MPLPMTPSPVRPLQPMPPESSPASPVVQTLDKDDDEDIAEDQLMPAQPLLPARRPRADSIADPGVAVEAPADVVPVAPPAEVTTQAGLPVPAAVAPSEGAIAPVQPMPHLQPQLPFSSSSPSALDDSTLPEPEAKKQKKHEEDDEKLAQDSTTPMQPIDPPVLPLAEHQTPVTADLEASRSRSRTHSEVSETPTIPYQDQPHDPPRQIGQEEASLPEQPGAPHQIRRHGLLPWRQPSSTPTLPRHMDEYMLDWVMSKTFSFGRLWANITLCSGWTTPKRRPPTTH